MQQVVFSCIYCIVFATGAAGLIFQVTWQKYVSRLLGSDSIATAIILGTFLGGLSIGYYLCGKFSARIKNHFKAYALLEGIIGIWCLLFPQIFVFVESLSHSWSFRPPIAILFQGILCAALLMGVPTICMGGTIPFLTRGFSRTVLQATHVHANVYAINTIGAFFGTLLAGFYLIPVHGLPITMMGTAFLDLGACAIVYGLSTFLPRESSPASEAPPINTHDSAIPMPTVVLPAWMLYFIAFLSGFYVMTLENVLIRITNISVGSSSYTFSLIIAVFILSIALGSTVVGRLHRISGRTLALNQMLIAIFLLLIYLSLDTWPYWAHLLRVAFQSNIAGFWAYYVSLFLVLSAILLLPVACMGATIPLAFHQLKRDLQHVGTNSGLLLSWNTLGNLTGSLVGGILLYYVFDNARIFLVAALLAACSAILAAWHTSRKNILAALSIAVVISIFLANMPFYNREHFIMGTFFLREPRAYTWKGPGAFFKHLMAGKQLLFYKDDPITSVSVVQLPNDPEVDDMPSLSIMVNGKSDSNTTLDLYTLKLLAHLPALLSGSRKQAMVIGLGTGVTAAELSLYADIDRIDIAEIAPAVIDALPLFGKATYNLHEDPRVHIHFGDAFRVLGRSDEHWDMIISEPSNPWVTGVDMLFTQEFYRLVNEHLTPDGMLSQWIHIYAANPEMVGMALNTLQQEFRYCRAFLANPGDLMILASNTPITPERLHIADTTMQRNPRVRASLDIIDLGTLDALLMRELWPPSYLRTQFIGAGQQTMDNPRLHYIAGKQYFMGQNVPLDFLFNATTAEFWQEYLLAQRYADWQDLDLTADQFDSLLLASQNVLSHTILPIFDSIVLKAHLADPGQYPLDDVRQTRFRPDIISLISDTVASQNSWNSIGLQDASIREKATMLLQHIEQTRTWIIPYPLYGLKTLLEQGVTDAQNASDKNWCMLQLALLLIKEYRDPAGANTVLQNIIKDANGAPLLASRDVKLIADVNRAFMQFAILSQ